MKVAMEIGWGQKTGGARTVALSILDHLLDLAPDDEFWLYCNTRRHDSGKNNFFERTLPAPAGVPQVIYDQFIFPHYTVPAHCRRDDADVIHYTNNYISLRPPAPAVVNVHDLTPFVIPDSYSPLHRYYQQWYIRRAVREAAVIVTISESSRRDLIRVLGADPEKIEVALCAADTRHFCPVTDPARLREVAEKYNLPKKFMLFVGTLAPRKNVDKILLAAEKLIKAGKECPPLVIAGRSGFQDPGLAETTRRAGLRDHVRFTGVVGYDELPVLYSLARLFVYPSRYEGFGLPPLEAMGCGTPTITSNVSSLPEVAGTAAMTIDPEDVDALADAIERVCGDEALYRQMSAAGPVQANKFNWRAAAEIYLNAYRRAAGSA